MKPIKVKYFEMWNMSISMLFGKTPKVHMVCGKCSHYFSKRFNFSDFRDGNPKTLCPNCYTVNYVPIVIK
jgi:hypothetical protein